MEENARLAEALADRYRIEREIGSGGMATVYLAEDLKHDRQVALKVLKPELAALVGADRFLSEIRTTAHLQHPNILPLFDSGEAVGQLFYVMPYVEGESLRDRLNREKQLPIDEAVRIATEVAEALQAAHDDGIIHRDIKPANILLRKGKPLVADFGIALAVSAAGGGRLTETGLSLGTPYYMSPEQASADRDPDARSDVYSLGCVLYEMLTGEPPFSGSTAQAVLARILTGDAVRPTEHRKAIPPNVDGAILKAIEKLPADRFASAIEFAKALSDMGFRHETGIGAQPGHIAGPGGRTWVGRLGWGVAAVLAVALAFVAIQGRSETPYTGAVRHYRIPLPDTLPLTFHGPAHLGVWQSSLALSDDGRLLAYAAYAGGTTRLLIHDLESTRTETLDGTEGAHSPFFSPDGHWVAFFTGGGLRTVPVSGGQTMPLGEYDEPVGGAWTKDGRILVAHDSGDKPLLVPAAGGEPDSLGSLPAAFITPSILPGDQWAVGVLWSGQLALCSMEDGEVLAITRRRVLPLDSVRSGEMLIGFDPQYVDSGHLLYLSNGDGGLMALPFDAESLEVLGDPVPVLDGVRKEGAYGFGHIAVAKDGTLVYAAGGNAHWGHLVLLDGSEVIDTLRFPRGQYDYLALSGDGRRLATAERDEEGGPWETWLWETETGRGIPLEVDDTLSVAPWSWTDENSLFVARFTVVTRGFIGSGEVSLSDGSLQALTSENLGWPALHPEGSQIIVQRRPAGSLAIFSRDAASSSELRWDGYQPSFSPDGRMLAFATSDGVMVTSWPDADRPELVAGPPAEQPRWSTNGDAVYYRGPGEFWRATVSESGGEIEIGEPELFASGPFVRVWAWAYAVMPGDADHPGDRLLAVMGPPERSTDHLEVITNFFSVLEERAPRRR